jgi:TonB family protein
LVGGHGAANAADPPRAAANPSPPAVVPPRLVAGGEVAYPEGATGDAVVTLRLVVNRDGSVRSAEPTRGDEPFASAAARAARAFRFEPATRGGEPVAATIHFEIRFLAPEPGATAPDGSVPAPPGSVPAPPGSVPAPPAAPAEVVVEGERPAPAVTSLKRAEVRQLPGAFGDPFRAIESMPGVTPIVSGLPYFYIRGSPPGNVGYFLDGVRVPYLYHVGLGPSIVNPALVDRVELYKGGYPARFGRFAGAVVSGETTAPRADFHGEGNLRLFDVGGVVEGGFAGGRGSVLLGGRYSYTAAVLSLVVKDVKLDYRDYQARVSYDFTPHDRVTAFAFGAYDLLGQKQPEGLRVLFGTEFYRLDLRYDHTYATDSRLRFAVTLGFDQTHLDVQRNSDDKLLGVRAELTHRLRPNAVLHAGADGTLDAYSVLHAKYVDPDDPDVNTFDAVFPPRNDYAFGTYADVVLDAAPGFEITPGLRADLYQSNGTTKPSLDGRLATRLTLARGVKLVGAFGLAHQPPAFVLPVPGLVPATLAGGLQTSFQTSAGTEFTLPAGISASATVFHDAFFDMNDALGTGLAVTSDTRALGEAYGLELYAHRDLTQKLGGLVSYTLSRSTRSVGNEKFVSAFDRTHIVNLALAYDLGANWRASTHFIYYTGLPRQPDVPNGLIQPRHPRHVEREPGFFRLDLRLEKRWNIKQSGWISFVAELLNATFHKETIGGTEIGPVTIPSLGVEGGF